MEKRFQKKNGGITLKRAMSGEAHLADRLTNIAAGDEPFATLCPT